MAADGFVDPARLDSFLAALPSWNSTTGSFKPAAQLSASASTTAASAATKASGAGDATEHSMTAAGTGISAIASGSSGAAADGLGGDGKAADATLSGGGDGMSDDAAAAALAKASYYPPLRELGSGVTFEAIAPFVSIIRQIGKTSQISHPWPAVRKLLSLLLQLTMEELESKAKERTVAIDGEALDVRYKRVQQLLTAFQRAPFTTQRMAELLTDHRRFYPSTSKFFSAFARCVCGITSTDEIVNEPTTAAGAAMDTNDGVSAALDDSKNTDLKPFASNAAAAGASGASPYPSPFASAASGSGNGNGASTAFPKGGQVFPAKNPSVLRPSGNPNSALTPAPANTEMDTATASTAASATATSSAPATATSASASTSTSTSASTSASVGSKPVLDRPGTPAKIPPSASQIYANFTSAAAAASAAGTASAAASPVAAPPGGAALLGAGGSGKPASTAPAPAGGKPKSTMDTD